MTRLAMRMTRRALAFAYSLALAGCSSDDRAPAPGGLAPADGAPSGPERPPSQSIDSLLPGAPGTPGTDGGGFNFGELDEGSSPDGLGGAASCLGETREAEQVGLDIFIMLDTSASMLDPLPALATGVLETKWDAVRASLETFVQSFEAAEIGIGLQYFPQVESDAPTVCDTSDQCGPVAGPCSNSLCVIEGSTDDDPDDFFPPLTFIRITDDGPRPCFDEADCGGPGETCRTILGECVAPPGLLAAAPDGTFLNMNPDPAGPLHSPLCSLQGDCAGLPGTTCDQLGLCEDLSGYCSTNVTCPTASTCFGIPATCVNQTRCAVEDYSTPAVAISAAPERSAAIITSLQSQVPSGLTPTGPALGGALVAAQGWAEQNPGRQVVTVLITDGFPTECSPLDIPEIAALARNASAAAPSVRTFVIGVFSDLDLADGGQARLDAIASAGNTGSALIVNTAGDVAGDFLAALDGVRRTSISCEFLLERGAMLDFERVNLQVTDAAGTQTPLFNVGDATGCGADERGWYYVRDAAGTPTQLSVCPGTCAALQVGEAKAELQVGCETRIR
jgi:hypothetical protein